MVEQTCTWRGAFFWPWGKTRFILGKLEKHKRVLSRITWFDPCFKCLKDLSNCCVETWLRGNDTEIQWKHHCHDPQGNDGSHQWCESSHFLNTFGIYLKHICWYMDVGTKSKLRKKSFPLFLHQHLPSSQAFSHGLGVTPSAPLVLQVFGLKLNYTTGFSGFPDYRQQVIELLGLCNWMSQFL